MSMPSPSAKNARRMEPQSPGSGLRRQPPHILQKGLQDGPGGNPARDAFHYLWKTVGENGEEVDELMAGELTLEALEGILKEGRRGKRSREQADLEDGEEIVGSATRDEFYQAYKQLRPLDMTKSWNSVRAYAEFAYKTDAGLLPAIPVNLEAPEYRDHIDQADRWFDQEVRPKGPGMRHRILVIEGERHWEDCLRPLKGIAQPNVQRMECGEPVGGRRCMDTGRHGIHKRQVLPQSPEPIRSGLHGRYQRVKTMKVRPTVILGNSRAAITRCWSDIEGEEGEAWVAKNMEWVYSGGRPFFVFP
ncbi:hypothetical protein RhiLY_06252 [Ceratobasidium sp. AG-Ba]|nr:hypothetical protein RhiLY_06252 [Ceratobasidium sp. AG-Ba]